MGTAIDQQTIIKDLAKSLFSSPRYIPAKYHYDTKGSLLFEKITELDEYYPTRCEREILKKYKKEIIDLTKHHPNLNLIELGAGDGHKTTPLLEELMTSKQNCAYIPIDVSESAIAKLLATLHSTYGSLLNVQGITADYLEGLSQINPIIRKMVLFLGSSIGNFDNHEAHKFLFSLRHFLEKDDILFVGFDLKKDIDILQKAYKDSKGVTAEFNLNVLDRLNHELNMNFNRDKFHFHSFYNNVEGRVESWLVSKETQTIEFPPLHKTFTLKAWEGIHMENSYKYNMRDIENLAHGAGFRIERIFKDPQNYFACAALKLRGKHES